MKINQECENGQLSVLAIIYAPALARMVRHPSSQASLCSSTNINGRAAQSQKMERLRLANTCQ